MAYKTEFASMAEKRRSEMQRIEEVKRLRLQVFELAKSFSGFAPEADSNIALSLHQACNNMLFAIQNFDAIQAGREADRALPSTKEQNVEQAGASEDLQFEGLD